MDKKAFMARVEELLKEQITELGEDPAAIAPQDYAAHMHCEVHSDGTMVYIWREMPILRLVPEKTPQGTVYWRMFTQDERGLDSVQ
ncbi:MAG: hypothetical protein IJD04_03995 [Desulfovibrionaceae bacterium]|nr:hypothetical protein [Desulfovibrionaceae bacterium]